MATVSKTFSVRYGIDVANTIIVDTARNVSNVNITSALINVTTANITTLESPVITAAYNQANSAYNQANSAYGQANTARDTANSAYAQANAAYDAANNKVSKSGDIITGDLTIDGNLYLSGNTTYINVTSLNVNDSIIYLASNNNLSDSIDIGLVGGKNTSGTYSHTGLIRHAADGKWYLFDNYLSEPDNNIVDVTQTTKAVLVANIESSSINIGGVAVANVNHVTDAYNQANSATGSIGNAYNAANAAYAQANSAANTARVSANGGSTLSAKQLNFVNSVSVLVSVTDAGDGNANIMFSASGASAADAYNQANLAYNQANAAYDAANTKVSKSGDTMTGTLFINSSGEGLQVANANVATNLFVGSLKVTTNSLTTTSTSQVVADAFPTSQLRTAKYLIQANQGATNIYATEVLVIQDGTNITITEYGSVQSSANVGSLTADISGGNARLLWSPNTSSSTTIKTARYGITP